MADTDSDTDISTRGTLLILAVIVLALAAVGGAVALWGLPALGLAGLALVPVAYVVLILLSVGK